MVVHFDYNGKILCGTKAANVLKTIIKGDVNCKRCLTKLVRLEKFDVNKTPVPEKAAPVVNKIEPVVTPIPAKRAEYVEARDVVFVMDRKYGPSLLMDDGVTVKLGDRIADRLGLLTIIGESGPTLTGPLLLGAESITKSTGVDTFRKWFRKQKETKEIVYISDVKTDFT